MAIKKNFNIQVESVVNNLKDVKIISGENTNQNNDSKEEKITSKTPKG